jgi:hypothetical protein
MQFDNLPAGAVVATVRLAGVIEKSPAGSLAVFTAGDDAGRRAVNAAINSPWLIGEYGWVVDEVFALPEPVPCPGFQRLWTLPPDVEARVLEQEQTRG